MSRPRTRRPRWAFERLDVRVLRRCGELEPGQEVLGSLALEWSPCPFGGARAYWRCPRCDRRCEVLFLADPAASGPIAADGHACRRCARVAYESSSMTRVDRLYTRRDAILDLLEMKAPAIGRGVIWRKPRRMHWDTFFRLRLLVQELELAALLAGYQSVMGRPFDG